MAMQFIKKIVRLGGIDLKRYNKALAHYKNLYNKYKDFTMIPEEAFVSNLELCTKFLKVEGDIVECGVWRGGMIAAIAELTEKNKTVHLFDSFEGLPPAQEIDGKEALNWQADSMSLGYHNNCSAEESFVISALRKANHENYQLYKGWFQDTLPTYKGNKIAILRLDGDWYDSVKECLLKLFPLVTESGVVIIDDYYTWDGCAKAVHDYLSEIKSPSRVYQWNNQVAYILKKN
jgi:O-methyltransferase